MQRFLTFSCSLEVIYCSLGYSGRVIASEQCWPWSLTREVHSKKGRDKQLLVLALHQLYMRTPTLLERGLACLLFQLTLSQSCTILKLSGSLSAFLWWDHYSSWNFFGSTSSCCSCYYYFCTEYSQFYTNCNSRSFFWVFHPV